MLRGVLGPRRYDAGRYEEYGMCVPAQLQALFVRLQTSSRREEKTTALTKARHRHRRTMSNRPRTRQHPPRSPPSASSPSHMSLPDWAC